MVVLITGAGLLGRHVAARLADRGDDVVVIDQKPVPAGVLPPGASAIQGDINDIEYISRQITRLGVTDVVHTAAMLAVSASDNPPRAVRTNLLSAVELLELARQGAIRRLILRQFRLHQLFGFRKSRRITYSRGFRGSGPERRT